MPDKTPRNKNKRMKTSSGLKTILSVGGMIVCAGLGVLVALFFVVAKDLPDPERLSERPVSESTKIFDRTGNVLLYEIHGEEKRTVIPFSEIPIIVKNATLAAEDLNFYSHPGIDLRGIFRALYVDIMTGSTAQGGSTITQQLIRNTLISKERTLQRKIKEALLALVLETRYSKDQILEFYLNQIPYGSNAYGIEAAAETFFGKSASSLTLAEAATIASLAKATTYYSPYGPHRAELFARKDRVLEQMERAGFITPEERVQAQKEPVIFQEPKKNIRAPHFVFYVKDYLLKLFDETTIENGGLKIVTTLDWDLQQKAEKAIADFAERNEKQLGAKNAALVAIDPKTGQILAMVGSRNYWETENDGNFNVATAPRQPGSAFKPLAYITALQKGYRPETVLFDVPTEFNPLCNPDFTPGPGVEEKDCYHPKNYDDTFRGPVTFRQALQQSLNVPSVKVLYLAGIEDTIKTAESLGVTSLKDRSRFGLSLVLGGGEVPLLELVSAYGAFAQEGTYYPKTPILKIEDARGKIIEEYTPRPVLALDPEATRELNSIMTDNEARVPVFIRENSLYFPDRTVAAKTGTTQENRDAWTVGYTPSLVAGVWVGNNNNTPMKQNTAGVLAAAPIWKRFMASALATSTPETFIPPAARATSKPILRGIWQGGAIIRIDKISKRAATEYTPAEFIEEVPVGEPHSILYWVDRADPEGAPPERPENDAQFKNWEAAVQKWLGTIGYKKAFSLILPGTDDIHTEKNKPTITFIRVSDSRSAQIKNALVLITGTFPIHEVTARFDTLPVPVTLQSPSHYAVSFPPDIDIGLHTVTVSALDIYGNRQTAEKEFSIGE